MNSAEFNNFYIKLTLLNYKFRTNTPFSEEDLEDIKILNILINQFNRLKHEGISLDVDTIIKNDSKVKFNNISSTQQPEPISIQMVDEIDSDSINNQEEESETSEDPDGDLQVETLTKDSLKLVKIIRNNNYYQIEFTPDSNIEIEYDNEEEEDNSDEQIETYPSLYKSYNSHIVSVA
jgi:hypothetical protein